MARSRASEDSLELLLDTICNTFGGILFIALLVCVLAQNTQPAGTAAAPTQAELAKVHDQRVATAKLQEVLGEIAALESALKHHRAVAESLQQQSGPTTSRGGPELAHLQSERDQLRQTRKDILNQVASVSSEVSQLKTEFKAAGAATAQARGDAARAAEELREARDSKLVAFRLPRVRATDKRQIPVLISDRRVRMPLTHDRAGKETGLNLAEIRVNLADSGVALVPNTGTVIADTEQARRALDKRFVVFRADADYLLFLVWPDSYAEFKLVRDRLVEKGFDYQVMLMDENTVLSLGGGGGGEPTEVQ